MASGSTSGQSFPYPLSTDRPSVHLDLKALAEAVEKRVVGVYNDTADRSTRVPTPQEGQVAFLKNTDTFTLYNGSTWVPMFPSVPTFTIGSVVPSNATGTNGDVFFKV